MAGSVIFDDLLGKLTKGDENEYWEGQYVISPNHKIRIIAELNNDTLKFPLKFRDFLVFAQKNEQTFRLAAAKSLLNLYNKTWRESDKPIISEVDFAESIKLSSISFDESDDFAGVYYQDGDLFAGHEIKVDVSYDGTILKADIP